MSRLIQIVIWLLVATTSIAADIYTANGLKDVFFGEALFHSYQGDWFQAIARLDTELGMYRCLDEPALDTLNSHIGQARFGVGDFELGYRMHLRAGRAMSAVIEGDLSEQVRNAATYRLARLYFRKDQPADALQALERMQGEVPTAIRNDVAFLRGQALLATGQFAEAERVFDSLRREKGFEGFAGYNLGIAQIRAGKEQDGRLGLDRTGQLESDTPVTAAIRDKSNLVLGYKLLDENAGVSAKLVLDRVRLDGPFSSRALLGSGWADASQGHFEKALVPWSILAQREITDPAVQEALIAVPYAYGKLNIFGKAAILYGKALEAFGQEVEKLAASITSIQEGKFLQALAREELKQDADWVVKLRDLPQAPETYYLIQLMASHDFQESLRNYLDLNELHRRLGSWERDLDAFEDIIRARRAYYEPLIPGIDREFRSLDAHMRLRLDQRDRIEKRLHAMLTAPRPGNLATAEERIATEKIDLLQQAAGGNDSNASAAIGDRLGRLRGLLLWNSISEYDRRLTDAYTHLHDLNEVLDRLQAQYTAFVRTRQAASQSYEGYDDQIRRERDRITAARGKVYGLLVRQGEILQNMAVSELKKRRERLEQYQITARFAIADSYDRAAKAQAEKSGSQ